MMVVQEQTQVPPMMPRVTYTEVSAAISFLCDTFGFVEHEETRYFDDAGNTILAEVSIDGQRVLIGQAGVHGQQSPSQLNGANTQMLIVYVADVDQHCAHAQQNGAALLMPLNDAPWGDRRYETVDTEGHRWAFHQHAAVS